jgi:hypothetical protein
MTLNTNAKLWVDELRSGKYKQGQGYLFNDGCYCCLGVACELYQQKVGDLEIREILDRRLYDGEEGILPEKVSKWLGLSTMEGDYFDEFRGTTTLHERNDDGDTFEEIADLIESEPPNLFKE